MLGNQNLVAFAATVDAPRAAQFYEHVLGLTLVSDSPYALAFDAHGTSLRIQKVEHFEPQPFTALGWQVPDIEAVIDGLAERGVEMARYHGLKQDSRGIWTTPGGARVAWFKDPDGNTLSITQMG